ncbi:MULTISPECIES: serine hydrolase [unclassified Streptomyces]|uniref:serine hydrolase n=1 Tax=unclassified Streptomyces TaxID=2593676 RepID=UPI00382E3A90
MNHVEAAKGVALDCPSGRACSYSSLGHNMLGRIVEVLTGTTWDQTLKDLLLTPLGGRPYGRMLATAGDVAWREFAQDTAGSVRSRACAAASGRAASPWPP